MKFTITFRDTETGEEPTRIIDAENIEAAYDKAHERAELLDLQVVAVDYGPGSIY